MKQISRRQFLKASAASAIGMTAAPLLSACTFPGLPTYMDQTTNNLSILSQAGFEADQVQFRYENYFINPKGDKAHKLWNRIVKTLNKLDIDGIILAADMIDFYSEANMACLREGCEKLKAPFMPLRPVRNGMAWSFCGITTASPSTWVNMVSGCWI